MYANQIDNKQKRYEMLKQLKKYMSQKRRYNQIMQDLSMATDRDLADMGISRHNIRDIALSAFRE